MSRISVLVILLCISLVALSCGSDSNSPTGGDEDVTGNPAITLSTANARPMAEVDIEGIPANATGLTALVTTAGGTTTNAYVERRNDGTLFFFVPLHPDEPVDGGDVDVEVTNGVGLTSKPASFGIASLPPASGPIFNDFVGRLQAHFDAWLDVHGTTRDELRNTDMALLPVTHIPLLFAHDILDNPDNPNSLRNVVDGPVPRFGSQALDFDVVDRLLDQAGVLSYFDTLTTRVDSLFQSGASPLVTVFSFGDVSPLDTSAACISGGRFGITTGAELDGAMDVANTAQREISGATGKVMGDIGAIAGGLSLIPALKPHASAIGGGLWVYQKMNEAAGSMLPSAFDNSATNFDLNPAEFDEDDPGPGHWDNFRVTAVSTGWKADKFVLESIMQFVGMKGTFTNHVEQYGDLGAELKGYLLTELTGIAFNLTPESDFIEVCPQTWPNIEVSDAKRMADGTIVQGQSVKAVGQNEYEPADVGISLLRVETEPGRFGGQAALKIKPVEVKAIDVDVSPDFVNAETQEILTFTATVTNAMDTGVDWVIPDALEEIDRQDDGRLLVVRCPNDPWSPALLIKAFSTSQGGIRGKPGAPERNAVATISNGSASVLVGPLGECLKPGEDLPFTATVLGVDDQSVTWSTDPPNTGRFEGNTYIAPNFKAGTVVIIATSVADPNAEGYAAVTIAGCECWWTANINGNRQFYWAGTNAVFGSAVPGLIGFTFETQVEGPGIHYPVITAGIFAGADATGTFQMNGTLEANSTDFWTPGDPDTEEFPEMTITSNDGETIEGTASGPFFRVVGMSDPPQFEKLRLSLRFKASDGTKALCQD